MRRWIVALARDVAGAVGMVTRSKRLYFAITAPVRLIEHDQFSIRNLRRELTRERYDEYCKELERVNHRRRMDNLE